ncbi:6-phosphogluconolactonase [Leptolyngbya sp. 'hensonii']|nr:6-phosphogluconolactonase [Leptolyngbya sp. 'hensonii']OLP19152.1 6-phosphogluconolactonase [Leptolyngbya sp. 'hensonii']
MERTIEVLSNQTDLIQRAFSLALAKIETAIEERGLCTIALAGGSTPKPLYEAMAEQILPWDKIHVFWGDERYVPPNHPDSNQAMARRTWLDRVPIPATNIHPIPTDEADPAIAAMKHEAELRLFFGDDKNIPTIDLILLGMGDDGHTASLFPHTEALQVQERLVTVGNKDGQPRITFTVPLINQARCVMFIVAGAGKQAALAQIFSPVADPMAYPARLIQPQRELWWLLDEAAGQQFKAASS